MKCPVCKQRVSLQEHSAEKARENLTEVTCPSCGATFELQAMKKLPAGIALMLVGFMPSFVIGKPWSIVWTIVVSGAILFWLLRWENVRPNTDHRT